ncbi:MAG: FixH family protein [Saprospiraceae bacterium]|nr:MAG: nitrogen fixation protein FixH [Bacteroidetes bacterium OLB9]MCO6463600.1 FixH family protein [Saprospiraceae bacterium]MCZ2337995.1 FixH family protein [Chitinophagales bacterium]
MKFNWGTGLGLFLILFVLTLVFVVYQSTKVHDSLVVEKYYEEDLAYQSMMEKKQNTASLAQKVQIKLIDGGKWILLKFPGDDYSNITGKVQLFSPITEEEDQVFKLELNPNAEFRIPVSELRKGKYRVKLNWQQKGVPYYQEEVIII